MDEEIEDEEELDEEGYENEGYECPICGAETDFETFCPECGARVGPDFDRD